MAPPDSTIYIVSLNKTPKRAMALLQRVIKVFPTTDIRDLFT